MELPSRKFRGLFKACALLVFLGLGKKEEFSLLEEESRLVINRWILGQRKLKSRPTIFLSLDSSGETEKKGKKKNFVGWRPGDAQENNT